MKLFVFCVFALCLITANALFGPKLKEKLLEREDACLRETGNTLLSIDRVRRTKTLPEDGSLDKFALCLLKKHRIVNDDDAVNKDKHRYYLILDDGRKKEYAEDCVLSSGGSNNDEIARHLLSCLLKTDIFFIDWSYRSQEVLSQLRQRQKQKTQA
ncbi:hypothetical protein TSAR_001461 [Trichomalopsis sarcophagae]|uniref:Uncharacterized protein n=1 Tax=Trichomalopsis sarcophagae TaxID=543379 RepID=A0A232EYC3_9HYME|nr:hypothetical protein TSAR_001461 [Trichomalopsis sarcophagae]